MKGQPALLVHRHLSPFRLTPLDHPLDHNTCFLDHSFNQNTLWITSFPGLGAAFMLSLRLSAVDVALGRRGVLGARAPRSLKPILGPSSLILFFPFSSLDIFTLCFYCFWLRSRSLESWFPRRDATRFIGTLVSTEPIRLLEHPPQLPGAPRSSGTQNPISFDPNRFFPGHQYPTRACSRVQVSAHCCV